MKHIVLVASPISHYMNSPIVCGPEATRRNTAVTLGFFWLLQAMTHPSRTAGLQVVRDGPPVDFLCTPAQASPCMGWEAGLEGMEWDRQGEEQGGNKAESTWNEGNTANTLPPSRLQSTFTSLFEFVPVI